jgi:hypothetical protein
VKVGEERLFFTDPYWLGEDIGVREKGSVSKDDLLFATKEIRLMIRQARARQNDTVLKRVLSNSRLVVAGVVISITVPDGVKAIGSEHDPEWRQAQVRVDETMKGATDNKSVKVLFPSSNDVMYFGSPKLHPGDEGIFIIQQADSLTFRTMHNSNVVIGPLGFIRGKENDRHIRDLIEHR